MLLTSSAIQYWWTIILTIVNDNSGKIPLELINKTLDITVPGVL